MLRLSATLLWVCLASNICADDRDRFTKVDRETIEGKYSLALGSGPRKLLVDTTQGYIHITAHAGSDVVLKAAKTVRAESNEALAEGAKTVKLDVSQQGNFLRLYVDAPWRTQTGGINYRGQRYYGYEVTYDFDLQVPRDVDLILRSVNRGDIQVEGTNGEYDIRAVNNGVILRDIAGFGEVQTVNGALTISYREDPKQSSAYKTLNGEVDITFRPGLSADMRFKTFNGSIYTDFDVASRPGAVQVAREVRNGKSVIRTSRFQTGRVGAGGPELSFETFNGTIRLHTAPK